MSKESSPYDVLKKLIWVVNPRELTEEDKLNAKLADLTEETASRLTPEELEQEADTAWMIAKQDKNHLGS